MMIFKRHLLLIAALFLLLPGLSFAEKQAVAGKVVAGEQGYEVAVEVENWKNEPLKNVVVGVKQAPPGLINFSVTPAKLESLAAGKTVPFIVTFDVATDAVKQDFVELIFSVSADETEFDLPNPRVALAVAALPAVAGGADPDGTVEAGAGPGDGGSDTQGPYVYVLTEINVSGTGEHKKNQLGYLRRHRDAVSERLEMVRCIDCPTQITLGKTAHFELETWTRYDSEKYKCLSESKSRWPPTADFKLVDTYEEFSATAQEPMLFPSCQELGVKERLVVPEGNGAHVPYTVLDPVGLTLDKRVSLKADLSFAKQTSDSKGKDQIFSYDATYSTNGKLTKEDNEGNITVEFKNSAKPWKLSDLPGDNEIGVEIGYLYLTYSLQKKGQPEPLNTVAFATPAEFSRPHLDSTPVVVASPPPGKEKSSKQKEPAPEIGNNEVDLPDVLGKTYKEAVELLEAAGLVALPPELGSNAPNSFFVGRIELTVPAVDGQLHRGDKIGLRVFGKAIVGVAVPNVVGLSIRAAAKKIEEAGLITEFELGGNTSDPRKDKTIASQSPQPEVEIKAGTVVKMIVLTLQEKTRPLPDLRGMPISQANKVLQDLGLAMLPALGDKTPANKREEGQVYRQSPEPGTAVKEGVAVNVWVYGKMETAAVSSPAKAVIAGGVPYITIPNMPVAKEISVRVAGDHTKSEKVRIGQKFRRPSNGFLNKEGWREIRIETYGGYEISILWQENSDERVQLKKSILMPVNDICSIGNGTKPLFTPSRSMNLFSGGVKMDANTEAVISLFSQTQRVRITIAYKVDEFMKEHQAEFFQLAETMMKEIEPYAKSCSDSESTVSPPTGRLHICKDPSIQADSYVLKYARGYGGGETSFAVKQGHLCYRQSYAKIIGSQVENYECRDKDFKNCSLKSTTNAERKDYDDGAYSLYFNGGKSWWTIRPSK